MPSKELSKQLLDVLCCPNCHSSLQYSKAKNFLRCKSKNCGKTFKVQDGIPLMVLAI